MKLRTRKQTAVVCGGDYKGQPPHSRQKTNPAPLPAPSILAVAMPRPCHAGLAGLAALVTLLLGPTPAAAARRSLLEGASAAGFSLPRKMVASCRSREFIAGALEDKWCARAPPHAPPPAPRAPRAPRAVGHRARFRVFTTKGGVEDRRSRPALGRPSRASRRSVADSLFSARGTPRTTVRVYQDAYAGGTMAQAKLTGSLGKKYVSSWKETAAASGGTFDLAPGLVSHFHSE